MLIGLDARGIQTGFKGHKTRGIGRYAEHLISQLPKIAPSDDFYLLFDKNKPVDYRDGGHNIFRLYHNFPQVFSLGREELNTQLFLNMTLKRLKADAFHFFCHKDVPWYCPQKTVVTILDLIELALPDLRIWYKSPLYKLKHLIDRRVVQKSAVIITISEHSKKDIIKYYGIRPDKIKVIYLAADDMVSEDNRINKFRLVREKYCIYKKFILYIGGIDPRKNVLGLIQAFFRLLHYSSLDCELVLAGKIHEEPEYPELRAVIQKLGLSDRVRIIGFVSKDDLPYLYKAADVFVFPSIYEGFGLPPLEAMNCGTPVITTDLSSIPEVVGKAALFINPYEPDEMARAIYDVINKSELRKKLITAGLMQAKKFSWDKTARETLAVYHSLEEKGVGRG
ncbi:glycosyltransferase family 4 protein [candidate division KSB1 bacterium]|nr:glycosyltransferase family 4 protein [candidate division KSB1 bacterium]